MSEYQYFEFQAIDKPLNEKEMKKLRSYSTRATITPTSFVNEYDWGDFKGDEDAWMKKYFDAFMYFANWGTRIFKLRLPSRLLNSEAAKEYCCGENMYIRASSDKIILNFEVEDIDDIYECYEDHFTLASLTSIRAELAHGDMRALYLGWLLSVQNGYLDDDEIEPHIPPGLKKLSASLESLVDFLCIDRELLHIAAQTSSTLKKAGKLNRKKIDAWVADLPGQEKDRIISELMIENDHSIISELLQKFIDEKKSASPLDDSKRRKVGDILQATEVYSEERNRIESERRAQEKARREREAAEARGRYLDGLAGKENQLWDFIENLIATKQPKKYDLAVEKLIDLRDHDHRSGGGDFQQRLDTLWETHARKPSLIDRIKKAKL